MSYNKSPLAFDDVRAVFDRALASPKGVRVTCASRGHAVNMRSRFNYLRQMDREAAHPEGDLMHGQSLYDKLVLRVPPKGAEDENVLYLEPRQVESLAVEDIT